MVTFLLFKESLEICPPPPVLSSWTKISDWFKSFNNWIRSSSCFQTNWFAALIPFWCCSIERTFSTSAWARSNEETLDKIFCSSRDGFCVFPINPSEFDEAWICSGFCCKFSVEIVSTDVWSGADSVVVSVWFLLSKFSISDGVFERESTDLCLFAWFHECFRGNGNIWIQNFSIIKIVRTVKPIFLQKINWIKFESVVHVYTFTTAKNDKQNTMRVENINDLKICVQPKGFWQKGWKHLKLRWTSKMQTKISV